LFGWLGDERERDVKINIICPATEVHVRKVCIIDAIFEKVRGSDTFGLQYTKQEYIIMRETPELYESIVKPYITAFPAARTQWWVSLLSISCDGGESSTGSRTFSAATQSNRKSSTPPQISSSSPT
jgi:m7GpppX diphosphatase